MTAVDILREYLEDEANVALERGLPTVTGAETLPGGLLREVQAPIVTAVSDAFAESADTFYPLLVAALQRDAAPEALLNLRMAIAREIARFNAGDVLTARRHEAEELSHG